MRIIYEQCSPQAVVYAAKELDAYLCRMLPELKDDNRTIRLAVEAKAAGERCEEIYDRENDSFRVVMTAAGGVIAGNRPRSVLLGVYDYLHYLGCRFLMPGREGEYVPRITCEKLWADYEKTASFYHRGVCIEGADSFENVREFIDWLPKVGFNSFFLQFKVPYAFFARWYHHEQNPYREAESFTYEDARRCMKLLEAELKKRDLLLHKVGHGWTGEVLGYETGSWDAVKEPLKEPEKSFAALVDGVRGLYKGAPMNTNLCYHNHEAADRFAEKVTAYARENPEVDYLHIWLADEYNNVCECAKCRKTTVSDQYAALLNEIDRRLREKGLDTRIVFLLYQELLWPPVKERLHHPERFVLMFAPISRTFEKSYDIGQIPKKLPEYVRNRITLPTNLGENLAFLRAWQAQFAGDSFVYDYPLGRAHYGDFGYVHIARIIGGDIKKLRRMGLNGYISCQELRAALPNALPNYVMGRVLFEEQADVEALIGEYFEAAYGKKAKDAKAYLEALSALKCCDYLNGKGERVDAQMAERMRRIEEICGAFEPEQYFQEIDTEDGTRESCGGSRLDGNGQPARLCWKLLAFHKEYILRLAGAMELLAKGRRQEAGEKWREMRRYLCSREDEFQPYLDVYRVLEVTQKYTGFQ